MGGCLVGGDTSATKNNEIARGLAKEKGKDKYVKKLLFLGSGGSGKSTLFKQLRTIHGAGYTKEDRLKFVDFIHEQIIHEMKLAVEHIELQGDEQYGDDDAKRDGGYDPFDDLTSEAKAAISILNAAGKNKLNDATAAACKTLWSERAIKEVYEKRAITKIEDSSAYFWNKIDEVMAPSYVPNEEDVLLARHRTTGVIQQKFTIKRNVFHIFDVGGQKSERKKWIHCFENVTAVIFVASLSCYDEVMFEDESTNSMVDSLDLFNEICNNSWFEKTSIILFLNKKDLFVDKIGNNKPITLCPEFEDYEGEQDNFEETTSYIKTAFEQRNKSVDKNIFTHMTCATDQNNVEKVFNDVQHIIVEHSLMSAGLMGDFGNEDNSANSGTNLM